MPLLVFCIPRMIEKSISSAYQLVRQAQVASVNNSVETNSSINKSFIDLPKELFEMLSSAGPYLHRDTLLLQKVIIVSFNNLGHPVLLEPD